MLSQMKLGYPTWMDAQQQQSMPAYLTAVYYKATLRTLSQALLRRHMLVNSKLSL